MGKTLHRNKLFSVEEVTVKLHKKVTFKDYIAKQKDTVAILPITKNGKIVFEKQYRPAANKVLYEIPAGHIEKGETPLSTARRELKEETGFNTSRMKLLTYFYPSPGILSNIEHLYIAENLKKGKQFLDKDEEIEIVEVSITNAVKLIKSRKIIDLKTIAAILYYKCFIENR